MLFRLLITKLIFLKFSYCFLLFLVVKEGSTKERVNYNDHGRKNNNFRKLNMKFYFHLNGTPP